MLKYYEQYQNELIGNKVKQQPNNKSRPCKPKTIITQAYELEESVIRNDFVRDRDRILHSKSFRRLEHKAQIFSHEKGDHFRTRLTHTIEVDQIARSLCRNLGLNDDLVEAIALGHDIGHTPFGHEGERALAAIMAGVDDLGGLIRYPIYHGGFKHNYQGLRTLDFIEGIYDQAEGLFLTWQTIDGILKHTNINNKNKTPICDIKKFSTNADFYFYDEESKINLLDYLHPVTLEGQIVYLADEIAQRQHDLDDTLSDDILKITVNEAIDIIKKCMQPSVLATIEKEIKSMAETFSKKLDTIKKRKDENKKRRNLVSTIIEYFIIDATYQSMENLLIMHDNEKDKFIFRGNRNCYSNRIINFSKMGEKINNAIATYINNRIVNSYDVNRFDAKAAYIVRHLFKAYYTNPRQMTDSVLRKLNCNLVDISNATGGIKVNVDGKRPNILLTNIRTGDPSHVEALLSLLKLDIDHSYSFYDSEINQHIKEALDDNCRTGELDEYKKINLNFKGKYLKRFNYDLWINNQEYKSKKITFNKNKPDTIYILLLRVNYLFLSSICDYIAGMTDNFAKEEYRKLYSIID
ncbi:MAG: dNTP triphosphohydrolase [Oscillospiraceae bacterium]|jgi:dGTPase|nr:dNTP triphosphohydrolase [Oscillospiraceae bacterium]